MKAWIAACVLAGLVAAGLGAPAGAALTSAPSAVTVALAGDVHGEGRVASLLGGGATRSSRWPACCGPPILPS